MYITHWHQLDNIFQSTTCVSSLSTFSAGEQRLILWGPVLQHWRRRHSSHLCFITSRFLSFILQPTIDKITVVHTNWAAKIHERLFADQWSCTYISGDAVAVTSTVNLYFGSKFRSRSTGIIMNNQVAIIIIINKSDITVVAIIFYFRWMTSPIPTWSMHLVCHLRKITWQVIFLLLVVSVLNVF